jgi:trehalose 6-phosphate synthase
VPNADVVVASNRGPVSFVAGDDGRLLMQRGGGGLVSGIAAAARGGELVWVCAALSTADRRAARSAERGRVCPTESIDVRMLDIDEVTFHRAYNAVANSTLWFVNHHLYDIPRAPVFDHRFGREWAAYLDYNSAFAAAIAEEAATGGRVLVQDYHLTLVPQLLRELRPDLRIGHFMHTPWAAPSYFSLLPDNVSRAVLAGILGADNVGFLSERWSALFLDCCATLPDAEVDRTAGTVTCAGRTTRVRVHPLGVDADELGARAGQPDVEARRTALVEAVRGRRILLRIDRTELSKNIVRGLYAYREMLRTFSQWRERVVHVVYAYPSRHDLPEYREYTGNVQRVAAEIDDEFGTPDWAPVLLEVNDDFARSLAAYRVADVLVVNPLRDGMNLVAKEGPVLSERGCALVLSREAGAADELGAAALLVNPFDVSQTADAMHAALSLNDRDRSERNRRLAAAATALPPRAWLDVQLAALG